MSVYGVSEGSATQVVDAGVEGASMFRGMPAVLGTKRGALPRRLKIELVNRGVPFFVDGTYPEMFTEEALSQLGDFMSVHVAEGVFQEKPFSLEDGRKENMIGYMEKRPEFAGDGKAYIILDHSEATIITRRTRDDFEYNLVDGRGVGLLDLRYVEDFVANTYPVARGPRVSVDASMIADALRTASIMTDIAEGVSDSIAGHVLVDSFTQDGRTVRRVIKEAIRDLETRKRDIIRARDMRRSFLRQEDKRLNNFDQRGPRSIIPIIEKPEEGEAPWNGVRRKTRREKCFIGGRSPDRGLIGIGQIIRYKESPIVLKPGREILLMQQPCASAYAEMRTLPARGEIRLKLEESNSLKVGGHLKTAIETQGGAAQLSVDEIVTELVSYLSGRREIVAERSSELTITPSADENPVTVSFVKTVVNGYDVIVKLGTRGRTIESIGTIENVSYYSQFILTTWLRGESSRLVVTHAPQQPIMDVGGKLHYYSTHVAGEREILSQVDDDTISGFTKIIPSHDDRVRPGLTGRINMAYQVTDQWTGLAIRLEQFGLSEIGNFRTSYIFKYALGPSDARELVKMEETTLGLRNTHDRAWTKFLEMLSAEIRVSPQALDEMLESLMIEGVTIGANDVVYIHKDNAAFQNMSGVVYIPMRVAKARLCLGMIYDSFTSDTNQIYGLLSANDMLREILPMCVNNSDEEKEIIIYPFTNSLKSLIVNGELPKREVQGMLSQRAVGAIKSGLLRYDDVSRSFHRGKYTPLIVVNIAGTDFLLDQLVGDMLQYLNRRGAHDGMVYFQNLIIGCVIENGAWNIYVNSSFRSSFVVKMYKNANDQYPGGGKARQNLFTTPSEVMTRGDSLGRFTGRETFELNL